MDLRFDAGDECALAIVSSNPFFRGSDHYVPNCIAIWWDWMVEEYCPDCDEFHYCLRPPYMLCFN